MSDLRLKSPSTARNREPILTVLRQYLPSEACVLELASGSGEHGVYFSRMMPGWEWQPSDTEPKALASIEAWQRHHQQTSQESERNDNFLAPRALDVTAAWPDEWCDKRFDAIVAINLIHISPWQVTQTLMRRASKHLSDDGVLFLYGPYRRNGQHTAPSNQDFDNDLRRRNSAWGVRNLESVEAEAAANGLVLEQIIEMPANNLSVIFRRQPSAL